MALLSPGLCCRKLTQPSADGRRSYASPSAVAMTDGFPFAGMDISRDPATPTIPDAVGTADVTCPGATIELSILPDARFALTSCVFWVQRPHIKREHGFGARTATWREVLQANTLCQGADRAS